MRITLTLVCMAGLAVGGFAQAPTVANPSFEVASLKISTPGITYAPKWGRNTWSAGPMSLAQLLRYAFDASHFVGLPSWNTTESYVINAKAEDGVILTPENVRPRLRRFLEDRMKLETHMETIEDSGYALVLAKGGPKLHESGKPFMMTAVTPTRIHAPSVDMDTFAKSLGSLINEPVANGTGLTGNYEFTLTLDPGDSPDSAPPSPFPTLQSIFPALQEQLGLKLESGHKIQVSTIVIDHVEHPTED
jgi:uncharacterized protein (TIGR03435 family)